MHSRWLADECGRGNDSSNNRPPNNFQNHLCIGVCPWNTQTHTHKHAQLIRFAKIKKLSDLIDAPHCIGSRYWHDWLGSKQRIDSCRRHKKCNFPIWEWFFLFKNVYSRNDEQDEARTSYTHSSPNGTTIDIVLDSNEHTLCVLHKYIVVYEPYGYAFVCDAVNNVVCNVNFG